MTKKGLAVVLLALPFLLFMSFASEEGGAHESSGSGMLGKIINFVILFGALVYFLRKPLLAALGGRTEGIRSSLKDARDFRASSEEKLAGARRDVAALGSEIARIKTLAQQEAAAERKRIRAAAEAEAARIRTLAGQDVEAQLKAGIRQLKAFTAELAAALAEEKIKSRMTDDLQSTLIDRSIERLGALHEESSSR